MCYARKETLEVLLSQKQTLYTQVLFFLILLEIQNIYFVIYNMQGISLNVKKIKLSCNETYFQ